MVRLKGMRMSYQSQSPQQKTMANGDSGFDHLDELARQLIRHLGVEGARRTCVDNRWKGVLAVIDRLG